MKVIIEGISIEWEYEVTFTFERNPQTICNFSRRQQLYIKL